MNLFVWRLFLFFLLLAEVISLLILDLSGLIAGPVAGFSLVSILFFLDKIKDREVVA